VADVKASKREGGCEKVGERHAQTQIARQRERDRNNHVHKYIHTQADEKRVTGLRYLLVVRRPSQQMKTMRTLF